MPATGVVLKAIIARLKAVSTSAGNRIYVEGTKEKPPSRPCIILSLLAGSRVEATGGWSGLARNMIQVDSIGDTLDTATALSAEVDTALHRWDGTLAGIIVDDILFDGESITFDYDDKTQVCATTYQISWRVA